MVILLAITVFVGIPIGYLAVAEYPRNDSLEVSAFLTAISGGVILSFALISVPISRMGAQAKIHEIRAISETVAEARSADDRIERFAFLREISEANRWIESAKYYNSTVLDIWFPDEVDDLEPIK